MTQLNPAIGAKQTILIATESTRGEGLKATTKSYLFPKVSGSITPIFEFARDNAGHGSIDSIYSSRVVGKSTNLNLSGYLSFSNIRKLIEAITGDVGDGNKTTYIRQNNNTHPTFVITSVNGDFLESTNQNIEILAAPYCSLNSFELNVSPKSFVSYSANFLGSEANKETTSAVVTAVKKNLVEEQKREKESNLIDFSNVKFYIAKRTAATSFADFNTKVDNGTIKPLSVQSLSFSIVKNVEQINKMGTMETETYNKQFGFSGSFEKLKYQDDFDYLNYVNDPLYMRIDFKNQAGNKTVFSIRCGKIMLENENTSDAVAEMQKQNITFMGAFADNNAETFVIDATNLKEAEGFIG